MNYITVASWSVLFIIVFWKTIKKPENFALFFILAIIFKGVTLSISGFNINFLDLIIFIPPFFYLIRKNVKLRFDKVALFMLLELMYMVTRSFFVEFDISRALQYSIHYGFILIIYLLLLSTLKYNTFNNKNINKFLNVIVLVTVFEIVLFLIKGYTGNALAFRNSFWSGEFASLQSITIQYLLLLTIRREFKKNNTVKLLLKLAILLVGILLSGTRAALILALIGFSISFMYVLKEYDFSKKVVRIFQGSVVLFFASIVSLYIMKELNLLDRFLAIIDFSQSTEYVRLVLWKAALSIWKDNIFFGVGPSFFNVYSQAHIDSFLSGHYLLLSPHHEVLQRLSEQGIIGFVIYLFFLFSGFSYSRRFKLNCNIGLLSFSVIATHLIAMFMGSGYSREILIFFMAYSSNVYYRKIEKD